MVAFGFTTDTAYCWYSDGTITVDAIPGGIVNYACADPDGNIYAKTYTPDGYYVGYKWALSLNSTSRSEWAICDTHTPSEWTWTYSGTGVAPTGWKYYGTNTRDTVGSVYAEGNIWVTCTLNGSDHTQLPDGRGNTFRLAAFSPSGQLLHIAGANASQINDYQDFHGITYDSKRRRLWILSGSEGLCYYDMATDLFVGGGTNLPGFPAGGHSQIVYQASTDTLWASSHYSRNDIIGYDPGTLTAKVSIPFSDHLGDGPYEQDAITLTTDDRSLIVAAEGSGAENYKDCLYQVDIATGARTVLVNSADLNAQYGFNTRDTFWDLWALPPISVTPNLSGLARANRNAFWRAR